MSINQINTQESMEIVRQLISDIFYSYLFKLIKTSQNIISLLMTFSIEKLPEIEAHLANNQTLTEGGLPGPLDASIFLALGKLPELNTFPNLHYWYLHIATFAPTQLAKWAEKHTAASQPKKEAKKEEEIDLFGDDEPAEAAPKPKAKVEPKAKKPKPIAKSILVFDVKVYEAEFDLDTLAKKILALEIDGLTWNNEPKQLDVAYGVKKLQIGCVIEDDKVLTDDIFQKILAWEDDVQSVDTVSMQKL